jgi:hypothetical protein
MEQRKLAAMRWIFLTDEKGKSEGISILENKNISGKNDGSAAAELF